MEIRRLSKRGGIIMLVVVGSLLVARTVPAAPPAGNVFATIVERLDQIIAILRPVSAPVTLISGVANSRSEDFYTCTLSNLGTTTINVTFTLRNLLTGEAQLPPHTEPVGQHETQGITVPGGFFALCAFEFAGIADDVRAHMLVTAGDGEPLANLEAR